MNGDDDVGVGDVDEAPVAAASSSSAAASLPRKRKYASTADAIYFKSNKQNGAAWLSNFWPFVDAKVAQSVPPEIRNADSSFEVDGVRFASVEHYFQSRKYAAINADAAEEIRLQPTALAAKKCNTKWKRVQPIDVAAWDAAGEEVMLRALRAKFRAPALRAALLATAPKKLIEVPGRGADRWAGEDGLMAKLLLQVRTELAAEAS